MDNRKTQRNDDLKGTLITRLNKIEGQIRGIKGMIENDIYCDDVLNQIAAAGAALSSVGRLVLENHVRTCFVRKLRNGEDEVIEEFITTISKIR